MTSGDLSEDRATANLGTGPFAGYGRAGAPLGGYAVLVLLFNALFGGLWLVARSLGRPMPERVHAADLLVLGVATHKLSRLIAKDSVTSVLRAPFAAYEGPAGPSEVNEQPRGEGIRLAIGELITCPFCIGQWIAALLGSGLVLAPRLTRLVSAVFAIASLADFLHFGYEATRKFSEQPTVSDEGAS